MAIFLTILKIIGIVLLCIIGLILLILLYLIFLPFWYQVRADIDREMNYKIHGRFCTFLHLFQIHFILEKGQEKCIKATLFGPHLKIYPRAVKKDNEDEEPIDIEDKEFQEDLEATIQSDIDAEYNISEASKDNVVDAFEDDIAQEAIDSDTTQESLNDSVENEDLVAIEANSEDDDSVETKEATTENTSDTASDEKDKKTFRQFMEELAIKLSDFFDRFKPSVIKAKINNKVTNAKNKAADILTKKDEILSLLQDEANQRLLKKLFGELRKLIDSLKLNMRGTDLDFSLGSPDLTGKVTGAMALFPFTYEKHVRIIPDFTEDDLYVDGKAYVKGRFKIASVLKFGIVMILDPTTRKLIKKFSGGEKENGEE